MGFPLPQSFSTQRWSPLRWSDISILDSRIKCDWVRASPSAGPSCSPLGTEERPRKGFRWAAVRSCSRRDPNLIAWNNTASRFGISWRVPGVSALTLRSGYGRFYEPLAGRYLDFGNPNALSAGLEYQWIDANHDGVFDYDEEGQVLRRFGGSYSAIDPALKQPYNDEFYAAAELTLPHGAFARIRVFERTEKNRIAAVNTGVPFSSYTPRQIVDPGPDGIAGTADDRTITVYAQNPATLGQDFFTLTNPAGLIMQQRGMLAEGGFKYSKLTVQGSLYVGQSRGMTNPGNDPWENDSGLVGSLYADPNTLINANGRPALDPGYIGKVWAFFRMPNRWGKLEVLNSAVVIGGSPYARQLLVTGLPQGPFMIDATPRGDGGGYRTDPVFQWNLRVSRAFESKKGTFRVSADVFNVLNRASKLRVDGSESRADVSTVPAEAEIQPPRFLRVGVLPGILKTLYCCVADRSLRASAWTTISDINIPSACAPASTNGCGLSERKGSTFSSFMVSIAAASAAFNPYSLDTACVLARKRNRRSCLWRNSYSSLFSLYDDGAGCL